MKNNFYAFESHKLYIDSFPSTYDNIINPVLDNSIETQLNEYRKNALEYSKQFNDKVTSDMGMGEENYFYQLSQQNITDSVFAIYELKVLYAYKYFEIKLKELISISYPNSPVNDLYKWEKTKKFFSDKGIVISKFDSYNNVNELRRVNNNLKHSGNRITDKIEGICEFKDLEYFELIHIQKFYLKVQDAPYDFIKELCAAIYDNLYDGSATNDISDQFDILDDELIF